MIGVFLKIIEQNFIFPKNELNHIGKTLSKCELIIADNCYLALQDFGGGILYFYLVVTAKKKRGKGVFEKFLCLIIAERKPAVFATITCHPAIVKVVIRVMEKCNYQLVTRNGKVTKTIVQKIKEDEGDAGNIEIVDERIIWRGFYGNDIPQRDKKF